MYSGGSRPTWTSILKPMSCISPMATAETSAFKRMWGAYGEKPQLSAPAKHDPDGPPSRAFSVAVHCVRLAKDGLVYVCDRNGDRVQVFHHDGTFVKEGLISPKTLGTGTAFDLDFTPDQKFFYVADGTNHKVWIMQRDSMAVSYTHL